MMTCVCVPHYIEPCPRMVGTFEALPAPTSHSSWLGRTGPTWFCSISNDLHPTCRRSIRKADFGFSGKSAEARREANNREDRFAVSLPARAATVKEAGFDMAGNRRGRSMLAILDS